MVPVAVKWKSADGLPAEAEGQAVEGNTHGGFLEINGQPPVGAQASLTNLLSRETTMVKVVSQRPAKDGAPRGVAVEFVAPNEAFWGAWGMREWVNAEFKA